MGDTFHVEPPALDRFAGTSAGREQDLAGLRGRMRNAEVPRDAFGYVPGIGGRVYEAYDEFVTGCTDSVSSAADSMGSIADAVRAVAHAYAGSDQAAADVIAAIRGVR
jgi:hypothetical protein